ncbi:MAG: type IV toxin-antitoxin system AbiEi family antitoxin [Thermodesulfovibrionales bacterium]|nr:type IV toxin-antitoxin system AbiEi family antitoxin [Thermodesulfovibrionales bacterium]
MDRRTNRDTQEEIFRLAIEAFRKNIQAQAEIEILAEEPAFAMGFRPDHRVRMMIQEKAMVYYAEIKTTITKPYKLLLLMHKEKLNYPLLLVAKYVNAQMAEQLRLDGIEFIDTAGNAFINQPPTYIFLKGNKPTEDVRTAPLKRAFKPAGLRIIYAFLCNPGFENKTYREIAGATDVALGTVGWIMKELKDLGFLLDMGKRGNKLTERENLFQRWVTAYPEKLRPKLILGHYKGEHGWWQQKKLDPLAAQWGGEVAAEKLTHYLKPEVITIYTTTQQLNQLLLGNRLRKDPEGDVEILEKFWKPVGKLEYEDLVHPILVYADLLATGNQRNIETAKMIYEQHIIRLIRED